MLIRLKKDSSKPLESYDKADKHAQFSLWQETLVVTYDAEIHGNQQADSRYACGAGQSSETVSFRVRESAIFLLHLA